MPPRLPLRPHRRRPLSIQFRSVSSNINLAGRHALVTGGSRGIGLAIARHLAFHSCRVTLLSRSEPSLKSALSILPKLPPNSPGHKYIAGDVASSAFWKSPPAALTGQDEGVGSAFEDEKVDILVNCAGITHPRLLVRSAPEDLENVIQTNLTGAMLAVRYLVKKRLMRADTTGTWQSKWSPVVINLASLLGLQGGRGAVAYSASKAGILGLTRALAAELGPTGIRVNAIVPGYIKTSMTAAMDPKVRAQVLQRIPLQRFGHADEVADAALFLATNQYANNCVINLDGGLSAA